MNPVLLVIAGPNGAGKTTVTVRLREERWSEGVEYINPDDIARDRFGDWNSPDAVLRAAQWAEIGTADPRINAARVAGRVMQGGHTVPIEKIVSRYERSMGNLPAAIQLANRAYIYDNSVDGTDARLSARTVDGALRKIYGALPEWVSNTVESLARHPQFVDLRQELAGCPLRPC